MPTVSTQEFTHLRAIPADRAIVVDGEGYQCDFTADPAIHAITWDGNHGLGEFHMVSGPPRHFVDLDVLKPYLAAWRKGRAIALRAEADRHQVELDALVLHEVTVKTSAGHLSDAVAVSDRTLADPALDPAQAAIEKNNRRLQALHLDSAQKQLETLAAQIESKTSALALANEKATQAEAAAA